MSYTTSLFVVLLVVVLWLVVTYNRLVTLRMRAKEALSDIDVQYKRRYDLIPNLMETVKGYMKHEASVLENVTKARAQAIDAQGTALERQGAENMLSQTLKSLFAVAESYPDLKANTNFLEFQRELADTENKIQASRRFFNATVGDLNTKIQTFPTNLIAGTFNFKEETFFSVDAEEEKQPVKVQF